MPHVRDVRATSHDQHDTMLVAALAAGDLAGTDRDQAIDLTRTCADCRSLHDDLLAIARATAATPPPYAMPARDFRLTPADAARLRPGGWRRIAAAFGGIRAGFGRPLGVGLATLGVLGLLVGNIQVPVGGSSSGSAVPASAAEDTTRNADRPSELSFGGPVPAASAAASMAAAALPDASASSVPQVLGPVSPVVGTSNGGAESLVSSAPTTESNRLEAATDGVAGRETFTSTQIDVLDLLSVVAIVAGLAVLLLTTLRRRRQA